MEGNALVQRPTSGDSIVGNNALLIGDSRTTAAPSSVLTKEEVLLSGDNPLHEAITKLLEAGKASTSPEVIMANKLLLDGI